MANTKITLTKADRFKTFLRSYFLLRSFNYERMQNGGVAYTLIPTIKKLYSKKRRSCRSTETSLGILQYPSLHGQPYLRSYHGLGRRSCQWS